MRMGRVPLYPVEITFDEYTEDALTARMTAMREWLDHYRFEPTIFRHTFTKLASCFRCISTSKQNTTTRRDSPISGPRLSIATATWRSATHQYLPTGEQGIPNDTAENLVARTRSRAGVELLS